MAIFFKSLLSNIPDGTDFATLSGWTTYVGPWIGNPSDSLIGATGARSGINYILTTSAGHHPADFCCSLYNCGQPFSRAYADLEPNQQFAFGTSPSNFVYMKWSKVFNGDTSTATSTDTTYVLGITDGPVVNGVRQSQTYNNNEIFYVQFNGDAHLSDKVRVGLVISGTTVTVSVNGIDVSEWVDQTMAGTAYANSRLGRYILQPELANPTSIGYCAYGGSESPSAMASELIARDNSDMVRITGTTFDRVSLDQSAYTISGTCSINSASSVNVSLYGSTSTIDSTTKFLTDYTGQIDASGNWTITTDAIPKIYEKTTITIEAQNNSVSGGAVDDYEYYVYVKDTPTPNDARVGGNASEFKYYDNTSPFRDLSKSMPFFCNVGNGDKAPMHEWVDTSWFNGAYDCIKPSESNGQLSTNLAPIGWKDANTGISAIIPWEIDPSFVNVPTILTLPAGLDFGIFNITNTTFTLDKNFYGPGKHKVVFHGARLCLNDHQYVNPYLVLLPTAGAANYGLPTEDWSWSWKVYGDTSSYILTDSYVNWWAKSGCQFIRWMKSQCVEEASYGDPIPSTMWTADNRLKLTDHCWAPLNKWCQNFPWEACIEVSNRAKKDIWMCLIRGAHEDYIRAFAALCRDTLDPSYKIYIEASNEVWNSSYAEFGGYKLEGYRRGLGLTGAVYGQDAGLYASGFPADWDATKTYAVGDEVEINAIYRSRTNHAGPGGSSGNDNPAAPVFNSMDWEVLQTADDSRIRAHKEDTLRMASIIRSELGTAQASRLETVLNTWYNAFHAQGNTLVSNYLSWGSANGSSGIDHITTAPYMNVLGIYDVDAYMSSDMRTAAAGADRVAAFRTRLLSDVDVRINGQLDNYRFLQTTAASLGLTCPALGTYEYSNSLTVGNWPEQATDSSGNWVDAAGLQELYQDVVAVLETVMPEVYHKLVTGMVGNIGGINAFFCQTQYTGGLLADGTILYGASNYYQNLYSISDSTTDFSNMFQQWAAANVAYGGTVFEIASIITAITRRRFAPMITITI